MTKKIKLSVIIVNYNSGAYALDCVHSLYKQKEIDFEIILIDNNSQDASVIMLREQLDSRVMLIESPENLGFGGANNLAVTKSQGEFVLFLNPDTVIPDSSALKLMVDMLERSPKVGMLGPAIEEPRKNKRVLPRYRYPSSSSLRYTEKFKNLPGKIAWLLGACLLFKRSTYDQIHGFDPDYFLYGEDADIGLKIRLAGYEIGYCDEVKITHVSGASEIGANSLEKWLRKKRGLFLFCAKHFHPKDGLHLANMSIIKSRLYLVALCFSGLFRNKSAEAYLDKKHRLKATIVAAKELKEKLFVQ